MHRLITWGGTRLYCSPMPILSCERMATSLSSITPSLSLALAKIRPPTLETLAKGDILRERGKESERRELKNDTIKYLSVC